MYSVVLNWKNFNVNLEKVSAYLKAHCSSEFDGLLCDSSNLTVVFKSEVSQQDSDVVTAYWNSATAATFYPTVEEIVANKINDAIIFGNKLIIEATIGNVAQGITQAGKTKEISDYLRGLQRYLKEGSLYAAMDEIDRLLGEGIPEEFYPFVTVERVTAFKTKIATYLGQ